MDTAQRFTIGSHSKSWHLVSWSSPDGSSVIKFAGSSAPDTVGGGQVIVRELVFMGTVKVHKEKGNDMSLGLQGSRKAFGREENLIARRLIDKNVPDNYTINTINNNYTTDKFQQTQWKSSR